MSKLQLHDITHGHGPNQVVEANDTEPRRQVFGHLRTTWPTVLPVVLLLPSSTVHAVQPETHGLLTVKIERVLV